VCALGAATRAEPRLAVRAEEQRARLPVPGVAEQEAVRAAFERASVVIDLLLGSDAATRSAARKLALRSLDVPPPSRRAAAKARPGERTFSFALGPLVEMFFRDDDAAARTACEDHSTSADPLVADAAALLASALDRPRTALARDLARRRALALRALRGAAPPSRARPSDRAELTRRIVEHYDAAKPPSGDPLAMTEQREEALLALAELGDASAVPSLVARAVTGDVAAVHMLGALGDRRVIPHLVELLRRGRPHDRMLETAVVRALVALGATDEAKVLRALLAENPMSSWREGLERGVLVREIVTALGALRDADAGPALLSILDARSHEYRAVLPAAAWAIGRIRYAPALATLERILFSPKEPPTCELIWAAGSVATTAEERARAAKLLDDLRALEPGAEMVRLTALAKLRGAEPPRTVDLRQALERALWEPAFRQEETSRRRTWALRSLEELAGLGRAGSARRRTRSEEDPFFLGHEAVRYFLTRDDHRVRRTAEEAFAACAVALPTTRRYYAVVLDDLDRRAGLDGLHEALRDPLGVFRHNVATKLAERGDPRSVRPLAEATARLFAEPPTSTYEYDDAPSHLVAFVRALAKLNLPEGNDVLIEGLRSGNHQVRAVVAENAPDDERFVPVLMAMLGDPRSFLRSRAERSLAALGVRPRSVGSDTPPRLAPV
jgi:hypothetical protein